MKEYTVRWVDDSLDINSGQAEVVNATRLMNQMSQQGWRVCCVAPGSNAQTCTGLFITFLRE